MSADPGKCCDCCPYTPTCEEIAELHDGEAFGEEYERWLAEDEVDDGAT